MPTEQVLEIALAVENSKCLTEVQHHLRRFAQELGYDRFVLFSASASLDGLVEHIYWLEGAWFEDNNPLDAETYIRHCPATQHITQQDEAFFWTKTMTSQGEWYRIVAKPRGSGVHGLQVPIFGRTGLQGAMSFGGTSISTTAATRLALTFLANTAFFTVRKLLAPPKEATAGYLSKREKEILVWTAAGWRQSAIADTLGLSVRTVENHLRNSRRRLGVATTAEAIRIAIRHGHIQG